MAENDTPATTPATTDERTRPSNRAPIYIAAAGAGVALLIAVIATALMSSRVHRAEEALQRGTAEVETATRRATEAEGRSLTKSLS